MPKKISKSANIIGGRKLNRSTENENVNIPKKSCELTIKRAIKKHKFLTLLSQYQTYKQISQNLKIGKSAISMAFKRFKQQGFINEDRTLTSAGIDFLKKVNIHAISKKVNPQVRGHDLVFTLSLPSINNWEKRTQYLKLKKILFKILPYMKSESIVIDERKVWLTNKSVIFFMGKSYFADTSIQAISKALEDLFSLIHQLEKKLKVSLKHPEGYLIRTSRQHFALIKNELAQQYLREHKKLMVRDEKGLWLIIDDSFNLEELENVHSLTALDDNMIVQDFFNDLKKDPSTLSDLKSLIGKVAQETLKNAQNQEVYNKNIEKHLKVLDEMSNTLKEIQKSLKKK